MFQYYKNEAVYVFTTIALGAEEICGFLIGGDCGHFHDPWKQNWTVTFPDVPKPHSMLFSYINEIIT